jgi:hypothetical protein
LSLQEASEITIEDREALRRAVKSLEHPSLAGRLTNLVGKSVERTGCEVCSDKRRPALSERHRLWQKRRRPLFAVLENDL